MAFPVQLEAVCELPLSSAEYNALPFADTAQDDTTPETAAATRDKLLKLISDHGLSDVFSVHLLHRHFDVPEAQVMVYVNVLGPNHPTYQILAPRKPKNTPNLQGRYFFAATDGSMKAYEFSSEPQPDINQYHSFCSLFWKEVTRLKAQEIFALGVRPYFSLTNATEIEIPDANATVFVENFELNGSFETDWTNPSEQWTEGLPLSQTRSGQRCRRGRRPPTVPRPRRNAAIHTALSSESWTTDEQGNDMLNLEEHCFLAGCGPFNVLTNAMNYVSMM